MTERPPNRDLTLFRRKYYWQYAVLIAAVAYLFLWDPLRVWWAYETATVEISAVKPLCAAFQAGDAMPLEVGDCTLLRQKMAGKPGMEIKPRTFVTFTYRSPADGRMHSGTIIRDRDQIGRPVSAGGRLTVQLSRNRPEDVRVPDLP